MSFIIKFLKGFSGFSGSVLMFIGMSLLFLTLIAGSMVANIDNLDSTISISMQNFLVNNKAEIRGYVEGTMQKNNVEITQEKLKALCANPGMLDAAREQGAVFKNALTEDVCGNIDSRSFEETKAAFLDTMLEQSMETFVKLPQTEELKATIREQGNQILAYKGMLIGMSIALYIIGIVLTFAGAGFNWLKGTYKVCVKTGVRLCTVALVLFIFSLMKADYVIEAMGTIESQVSQSMSTQAPPILLKLIAQVILEWLKLSTSPYILIAILAGIPFIAVAVFLKLRIKKQETTAQKTVV